MGVMKLKYNFPVFNENDYIYGGMVGIITNIQISNNCENIILSYKYKNNNNDTIWMGDFKVNGDDIDTLTDEVMVLVDKDYNNLTERIKLTLKYYGMFMILTSRKFKILLSDIIIIDTDLFEYK
jgi:hypothetical protein